MKQFFVVFFANLLAILVVLSVPATLVTILVISALLDPDTASSDSVTITDGTVLVFDMDVNLVDSPEHDTEDDPLKSAIHGSSEVESIPLRHVILAIRHAADDSRIKALYMQGSLEPQEFGTGYSNLLELRNAILDFKARGKKVYAYLESATAKDYFVACCADKVYLNAYGELDTPGLASVKSYYLDAFQKLGVQVQVTKVGKYKSAVEPFIRDKMSDEDREETTALLSDLWDKFKETVVKSRSSVKAMTADSLQQLIDTEGYIPAQKALDMGLVDEFMYRGEVIKMLSSAYPSEATDTSPFKQVTVRDYYNTTKSTNIKASKVAILYLEGEIVDGDGSESNIGGDRFARYVRYLAAESSIKAVVLRVNSPGGSAFASEVLQHEIRQLKKEKPVIVSMGNYAASGGYWISAYSDKIYAEPNTITGSIGVFGMFFNVKGLADMVGVTTDTVKVGNFADFETVFRPKTDQEISLAQERVDYLYKEFKRKVSEGRGISVDDVETIAQGRVWSGERAKDKKLVNELGGLDDAIAAAVDAARLKDGTYSVVEYPRTVKLSEKIALLLQGYKEPVMESQSLAQIMGWHDMASGNPVLRQLSQVESQLESLKNFNDPAGMYARMPLQTNLR